MLLRQIKNSKQVTSKRVHKGKSGKHYYELQAVYEFTI